ncbi:DUF296 domain-containing protein [Candidatus Saccharibacteria bacterium]|nr:DUF296 domain-containing protein [Candidatus Saccharibacteria bacterium]
MRHIRYIFENTGDFVADLNRRLEIDSVKNAAITSIIGGVESCTISTMSKDDATIYKLTEYLEPLELLGNGDVSDGTLHIHATLGRENDIAIMGHLHKASVKTWFVKVYLQEIE